MAGEDLSTPEQPQTPEQVLLDQYAYFAEGLLDAHISGADTDKVMDIFMQGFLEQNAAALPVDVADRLTDKRLELVRKISRKDDTTRQ